MESSSLIHWHDAVDQHGKPICVANFEGYAFSVFQSMQHQGYLGVVNGPTGPCITVVDESLMSCKASLAEKYDELCSRGLQYCGPILKPMHITLQPHQIHHGDQHRQWRQ